ncbi:MAG: hypothetical protein M3Q81_03610 [bacterium]|nr:hypothetical protein [bacterium]
MLSLMVLLISGGVLVYVAQANLMLVSVRVGPYILADIPLFYVIIGSFVAGLAISYIFRILHDISGSLVLRGKRKEITQGKTDVLELTKRVHQLELENQKLKLGHLSAPKDSKSL